MILEFSLVSSSSKSVTLTFESTFDPLNQTHNPETMCSGGGGVEVDVAFKFNSNFSTSSMFVYEGVLLTKDDRDRSIYVTICTQQSNLTQQTIEISSTVQVISTMASSIDFGPDLIDQMAVTLEAINRFDEALSKRNSILNDHIQAWANLWKSGIDIQPMDDQSFVQSKIVLDSDRNGQNDTVISTFSRALDIAQHVNTSMYFLLSSSRDDWP